MFASANPQVRRRLRRALIGCATFSLLALAWTTIPGGTWLEQNLLDWRYAHFNRPAAPSDKVVVIEIDEQSFKVLGPHFGRWPFPRRIYKEMIDFLGAGEPAGIFFDLQFTESQLGTDDDAQLAEVSGLTGLASHAMLLLSDKASDSTGPGRAPLPPGFADKFGLRLDWASSWRPRTPEFLDFLAPVPVYVEKSKRIHLVTTNTDADGVFRRMPIALKYGDTWLPSLTLGGVLSTFKPGAKISGDETGYRIQGTQGDQAVDLRVPAGGDGNFPLHYYQASHDFKTYGLGEIIGASAKMQAGQDPSTLKPSPLDFEGKVILLGGAAAALEDLKRTPIDGHYPGVKLHATAISNILTQDFLTPVDGGIQVALSLMILALLYGFIFLLENVTAKLVLPVVLLGLQAAVAVWLFRYENVWLEMARPLVLGFAAIFDSIGYMIFVESRDKKKLKDTLSKYLPPAMTERIIATGQDPRAEVGQRTELSILFSDIRGFTTLSEAMPAEKLVGILNQYLGRMTDTVFDHLGTLDKFIGDAVMAFWGAPVADPDHALHAIRCALKMADALVELNREWAKLGLPELAIGVGINTGEVIVGNIGSERRLDYTVIGDNVNLSSRLEGLTKQYKVKLLVGPRTGELARAHFLLRTIDFVKVKGKQQAVQIFEPICALDDPRAAGFRERVQRFEGALELYRMGAFAEARAAFQKIQASTPDGDGPSQVFLERCDDLLETPPPKDEWDGVYVAKSK